MSFVTKKISNDGTTLTEALFVFIFLACFKEYETKNTSKKHTNLACKNGETYLQLYT